MTEVIIHNERRLVEITGLGLQGASGAFFHVLDDAAELTGELGNNGDTAITIIDGHEYRKVDGVWGATGRLFWGTLLPDTREASSKAVAASELAQKWSENPEDEPVVEGGYSARHWALKTAALATTSLKAIGQAADESLLGLDRAVDAALLDITQARSSALHDVEESTKPAAEYRRLTGLDAEATAADRRVIADDRVQTELDRQQTGLDRSAVAQDKSYVHGALQLMRTEHVAYIWKSDGSAIAPGRYLATAIAPVGGVFDTMSLSVPTGSGAITVQLTINGLPVSLAYTVTAAAPVNLSNQTINIAQGDRVAFAVLGATASQLWAQITGLLK